MGRNITLQLIIILSLTVNAYGLDCPADSAYHTDLRTLLPNGSPNPTFNEVIATGLCGCISFASELSGIEEDSSLTLTFMLVDNESIRGAQIDIYHDAGSALSYDQGGEVIKGDKLMDLDDPTTPNVIETMTLLANEMDNFIRVMAYSTSRAHTSGDGVEGSIFHITYKATDGLALLPPTISFGLGALDIPGTSMDPEILNVACSYPDTSEMVSFSTTNLGVISQDGIPVQYNLSQNYPNPFNPSTRISFDLVEPGQATLFIYNLLGKRINILINRAMDAGHHRVEWNGLDMSGQPVSSGVYFYELRSEKYTARKKMLLLR
ncbi:MAG: hypothetical protein CM1200mP10_03420 [Candidatus Neomarinimicrobiota bacterium]|nr:MAG: hypothetical protein CM1200mP10_03420 [Candidatus Neomarinimicrobiota bacterium]